MNKLTHVAFAVMVSFFLTTLLATAIYNESSDPTKTSFYVYSNSQNLSQVDENGTLINSEDSVSNMQRAATTIAEKLGNAQRQISSQSVLDKLAGAFGVLTALTIDVVVLLLAILLDGFNFFAGIAMNFDNPYMPLPLKLFGSLIGLGLGMFVVFVVFRIVSVAMKWEV